MLFIIKSSMFLSVFVFIMEARAPARSRGLMLVLVLSVLNQTAWGSLGKHLMTETHFSTDTEDSERATDFTTYSRAVVSEGTGSFRFSSTAEISELLHPSFTNSESHTATDQRASTEVTESWTTQNRSDMSTELSDSSSEFHTHTITKWVDPSTFADITDGSTVGEHRQSASEIRTVRDLTGTEQERTDKDTTESDSNTDSIVISTTHSRADLDATKPASNTESTNRSTTHSRADVDTTKPGSNTHSINRSTTHSRADVDTTESDSNTGSINIYTTRSRADVDTTKPGSNTDNINRSTTHSRADVDTTESDSNTGSINIYTTRSRADVDTTKPGSNTDNINRSTTHNLSDVDAKESGSNTDSINRSTTHSRADLYTTESGSNTDSINRSTTHIRVDIDTTESGSNTNSIYISTAHSRADLDTTESGTNTDSINIYTTHSRAGERTLLSIVSSSTTGYVNGNSSSETSSHAVTGLVEKTVATQQMESTDYTHSIESGHSAATSENFSTNATQNKSITQSHTGLPTVTDFESMSKTSNPSSTPPLTVISETYTTANSTTNQSFYTASSSSSSFTPFVLPNNTHTNVPYNKTTETPTGPMSSISGKKRDQPQTTTVAGLTTAPSTLWGMTTITSVGESQSTHQTSTPETNNPPEPTELPSTTAGPVTHKPPTVTKNDTHEASTVPVTSTMLVSTDSTASFTTYVSQASTTAEAHSALHSTLSAIETTQKTGPTTLHHHPTTRTATSSLSASSSQSGAGATDLSTLHFETSTATPGSSTANRQHTTASYNKSTPTTSTAIITTGKRADIEAPTTQLPVKLSPTPGHTCTHQTCANGGKCVGGYRCECLPAWKGENCTEDVDECAKSPCPQDSTCKNTNGSFSCECALGYDLQDGRSCTPTKTFLGIFRANSSLHDSHREILQLLNSSLSNLHGYRRSTLSYLNTSLHILAVNMFCMSSNVTSIDVFSKIQMSLGNCSKPQSHCSKRHHHQFTYQVESLCSVQKNRCDTQYAVCNDTDGTAYCQCHEGYFKKSSEDTTCRDCGDGFKLVNGTCMKCPFGFGGFNCNNFYGLIAKVVSPAAGGLLLIVIIALIITCCRKDKNDINKMIFKSGDLQMSPYGEFPKSSRVSMEWGRETIEMQENGSTKNLLQMTDIYYSPALRNADLERNGLYPFSGLPGSRHSCIYPAQWNPSFISDDSRRRDYF